MIQNKKKDPKVVETETLHLLFSQLGLSAKSAQIYEVLLEKKGAKVVQIASLSGVKRSNAYVLLSELEALGLVEGYEKSGVQYYRAASPDTILNLLEEKQHELLVTKVLATKMVKSLKKQWKVTVGRPVVQYYEGRESIQKVFEDIYSKKTEPVYGCVDLEVADTVFPEEITKKLIPLRIKNKLYAYTALADSQQARLVASKDAKQFRTSLLIDKEKYPLPAEIDVYEDRIAMLSFDKGDFVATVIENKDFAQTLKSLFKLLFDTNQSS